MTTRGIPYLLAERWTDGLPPIQALTLVSGVRLEGAVTVERFTIYKDSEVVLFRVAHLGINVDVDVVTLVEPADVAAIEYSEFNEAHASSQQEQEP